MVLLGGSLLFGVERRGYSRFLRALGVFDVVGIVFAGER